MQLFSVMMPKMMYFLLLIMLGFFLAKMGMIPKDSLSTLSSLVVRVFLPCLQMGLVFERGTTFGTFLDQRYFALMQLTAYILLTLLGLAGAWVLQLRFPRKNSFTGGMVGGNFGFLFVPLILSVFPEYQGYIPIMAAVDTLYVWTVGLLLYTEGCGEKKGLSAGVFLKRLLNPMLIAILIALLLSTLHVPVLGPVRDVISNVGDVSGTIGMILLGANIFYMNKHLKGAGISVTGFVCIRQILAPILVYLISRPLVGASEALLLMMLTGIPTMTTTGLLAVEYRTDVDFASNLVLVSTLSSLLTLPFLGFISSFL